ncbi:type III secretion system chaperone family protein [Tsukamurella soli]|uniref:Uncharacterized protein n=1 Tax=Tsukamurella soli TaxID=644556 RepID=A0ABP8JZ25_9ACTN
MGLFRRNSVNPVAASAEEHGWRYAGSNDALAYLANHEPFTGAHHPGAYDVVRGEIDGHQFTAFLLQSEDTTWDSDGDMYTNNINHMIVTIPTPGSPHSLEITPTGHFGGVKRALTAHKVTFESQAFNDEFIVSAKDPRFAHAVLHAQNIQRMLDDPRKPLPLWFERDLLMTWKQTRLKVDEIEPRVRYLIDNLAPIPPSAWEID